MRPERLGRVYVLPSNVIALYIFVSHFYNFGLESRKYGRRDPSR
jgi:hypothetical protein